MTFPEPFTHTNMHLGLSGKREAVNLGNKFKGLAINSYRLPLHGTSGEKSSDWICVQFQL